MGTFGMKSSVWQCSTLEFGNEEEEVKVGPRELGVLDFFSTYSKSAKFGSAADSDAVFAVK